MGKADKTKSKVLIDDIKADHHFTRGLSYNALHVKSYVQSVAMIVMRR